MTEKRFYIAESNLIEGYCVFDREKKYAFHPRPRKADCLNDAHILNELHDENEQLNEDVRRRKENEKILIKTANDLNELIDKLEKENEQLKQQLEDITLNWTENHIDFDKDELYIKDNNTEITLKNNNLLISVCIPQIQEHFKFHYIVTGRRLEREYQYFKR